MTEPSTRALKVYLNGSLVARDRARLNVSDRGFRFGDGAFESMRVSAGVAYGLDKHLARLATSLAQLRILAPPVEELTKAVLATVAANAVVDGIVRIFVSRGEDPNGRGFLPGPILQPTLLVEAIAADLGTTSGATLRLWLSSYRRADPRTLPHGGKLMSAATSTLARIEADDHDCDEALLLGPHAEVCETSSANVMWVADGALYTPQQSLPIVAGTIRERVLELADLPVRAGCFSLEDVLSADEVFVTNVAWLVKSVTSLDSDAAECRGRWTASAHADRLLAAIEEDVAADVAARQAAMG